MNERAPAESLDERIALAKESIVRNGSFPRAVFSRTLAEHGFITPEDQSLFCENLISDPDNGHGRVLVIYRGQNEKLSPVRLFGRGRENSLEETFVPPHIEPQENIVEIIELVDGDATVVIYQEDNLESECEFIRLEKNDPVVILPGQIHSVLFHSAIVQLVEFKVSGDADKTMPQFAVEHGLVSEDGAQMSGPQVDSYLDMMHERVGR